MCHKDKKLMSSHLLPASTYRKITKYEGEPSKILLIANHTAVYSDTQIQKPLLCHDCEELLNISGEKQICMDLAKSKTDFPLRLWFRNEKKEIIFANPDRNEHNASQYLYFALSVFWRAAITTWMKGYSFSGGLLGAEERVRQYLLTKDTASVFDIHLAVLINNNPRLNPQSCLPQPNENDKNNIFFVVPGIIFFAFLNNSFPEAEVLNKHGLRVVFQETDFEKFYESSGLQKHASDVIPKGKYAEDLRKSGNPISR